MLVLNRRKRPPEGGRKEWTSMGRMKKRTIRKQRRAVKLAMRFVTWMMFTVFMMCACALDSPAVGGKAALAGMIVSGVWLCMFAYANSSERR